MMNRVVLVGRLTKDPELRYTPNGVAVANFTVACNRPFSNQQGNREADFINCVVWRRTAENLANFMKKGSLIGVDGRIQTRSFDNQEGRRIFMTEVLAENIQFLESKGSSQGGSGSSGFQTRQNPPQEQNRPNDYEDNPFENSGEPIDLSDDDLPF
ncbi:single-stranded DNA-binding protein [Salinibacillus xinjiangensis]|uniref:Single-stranded DNA-binding protein n=1 Tax=Salinibacillus xinjiangensis TaxID=1229268 RepID=A0A6G1XAK1_9BACI|nr:single-stranded DNA-binding protein [Salinibacillus xinjiangensis]MRG87967.1 single-stranded DNA-binding protein [Salinibacillus xinjiangensis]